MKTPEGELPQYGVAERCAVLRAAGLPIYLTAAEVAELLGLPSPRYILRNAERWPHVRIARQIRFTPEQVESIAEAHTVGPSTPGDDGPMFTGQRTRGNRYNRAPA